MIKLSWIPFGNRNIASSRIRVYQIHDCIRKIFRNEFESIIGSNLESNIVIIQKNLEDSTLEFVNQFKGKIIFDCIDDVYTHKNFVPIISKSQLIITNNINHKKDLNISFPNIRCEIIDDSIDYSINSFILPKLNVGKEIVWYGSATSNLNSILPIFDILKDNKKYHLNVIANTYRSLWDNQRAYNFDFQTWNLKTFTSVLQEYDLSILSHEGDRSQYKSNNKLLVNIMLGIPTIVFNSYSYELLMKECQLEKFILKKRNDIISLLNELQTYDQRIEYLKKIQSYVLYKYNVTEVTKTFINQIREIL